MPVPFGSRSLGGEYRSENVYAGSSKFPKPSDTPKAMKSLVTNLAGDLENAEKSG